jgi:hypothetical protein
MDRSTEMKNIEGDSWFSLFFWPAFRRIFFFGKRLELSRERPDRWSRPADLNSKKPAERFLECAVPQVIIETQIEQWIRWSLESNIALVAALKRLRSSYTLIQAGKPVKDADEVLAQVEAVLQAVENTRM